MVSSFLFVIILGLMVAFDTVSLGFAVLVRTRYKYRAGSIFAGLLLVLGVVVLAVSGSLGICAFLVPLRPQFHSSSSGS